MPTPTPEIRPGEDGDLPRLLRAFGQEHFFTDVLARQRAGRGQVLLAWLDDQLVGNVYLWLESPVEPEVRAALPDVPLLQHLEVTEPHRNRGVGTAIVVGAEDWLRKLGHSRVALGVRLDNPRARRLYDRLGYSEWAHPPIRNLYRRHPATGRIVPDDETYTILIKDL